MSKIFGAIPSFAFVCYCTIPLYGSVLSYSFETAGFDGIGRPSQWAENFNLPKFNNPGATLNRIDIELEVTTTLTVDSINSSPFAGTVRFASDGVVNVFYPTGGAFRPYGQYVWLPSGGSFEIQPGGVVHYTGPTLRGASSFRVSGSQFPHTEYLGAGFVLFTIYGQDSGPDGMGFGPRLQEAVGTYSTLKTNSAAKLTVSYDFTETVPEPGTWSTLALGLLGLGLVRGYKQLRQ